VPSFYGRTLFLTVPAACTGPPCLEMVQIHVATKNQGSAWNSTNFSQVTAVSISAYRCPINELKNVNNHCCCPISAIILTTSKLEICRFSRKLSKRGKGIWGGGGGKLSLAPLPVGAQISSGYMPGDTLSTCYTSVSFSFSTFLCLPASWAGVDKKCSHYLCRTRFILFRFPLVGFSLSKLAFKKAFYCNISS
jgi:hypothetical protein